MVVDSQQSRIQFSTIFDLKYDKEATTAADFYRDYRDQVIASLKKKGDIIPWQDNRVLDEDEQLSPTFEELILAHVLGLIDTRLPEYVRDHFMESTKSLMECQSDILVKVPTFIAELENMISESLNEPEDKPER
jgi:DNA replication initiation complex subunit (GINS family)